MCVQWLAKIIKHSHSSQNIWHVTLQARCSVSDDAFKYTFRVTVMFVGVPLSSFFKFVFIIVRRVNWTSYFYRILKLKSRVHSRLIAANGPAAIECSNQLGKCWIVYDVTRSVDRHTRLLINSRKHTRNKRTFRKPVYVIFFIGIIRSNRRLLYT